MNLVAGVSVADVKIDVKQPTVNEETTKITHPLTFIESAVEELSKPFVSSILTDQERELAFESELRK